MSEGVGLPDDLAASLHALSVALDERDSYTHGHCDRVGQYAVELGSRIGLDAARSARLALAARFHDIGKIGIPDDVLLHPGRLEGEQLQIMRSHAARGARVFAATGRTDAMEVAEIIRAHHEAIDGSGYPDALVGDAIAVEARILAVVDGYDAMTSDRAYRSALPHDEAVRRLRGDSGRRLDGALVEAFIDLVERGPAHRSLI